MNHRLEAVCQQMSHHQLDMLLLSNPANLHYLSAQWLHPGRRLLVLAVSADGACQWIANGLLPVAPSSIPVRTHRDQDDWIGAVAQVLPQGARVGVDRDWNAGFLLALMDRRPDCTWTNGSPCIEAVRRCKEPGELALLEEAAAKNDFVMDQLVRRIAADRSECQLASYFPELCGRVGTTEGGGVIAYGRNGLDAHHHADNTLPQPGDTILLDIGACWKGYRSDMTRTFLYQQASAQQEDAYAAVLEAHIAAAQAAAVGMPIGELDRIATEVLTQAGYGDHLTHRLGHCIGLEIHELPYLSAPEQTPLEAGMVFTIEPGVYAPAVGGIRIEDTYVMTEQGARSLQQYPKDFQILT